LRRGHAGRGHGLMAVAQDRVIEEHRFSFHVSKY